MRTPDVSWEHVDLGIWREVEKMVAVLQWIISRVIDYLFNFSFLLLSSGFDETHHSAFLQFDRPVEFNACMIPV